MPPMQRHAVHRGRHAVLADAVVDEAAGEIRRRDRLHRLGLGVVRAGEIGRAADHLRHRRHQRLERELGGRAGRDVLRRGGELLLHGLHRGGEPVVGQLAVHAALELVALVRRRAHRAAAARRAAHRPSAARRRARRRARRPGSRTPARSSRAWCARRRSRRRRAAEPWHFSVPALVGAPKPIVVRQAISVGRSDALACSIARGDRLRVVAVDAARRPAGGLEALHLVDRVGQRQRAVDRDAVVVEQHDQLVEPQVPGERDRLLGDAFHQVAVGGEHVGVVVDDAAAELARRDAARPSPCRPRWRGPGRAGRWWSRRRACGRTRDARR